MTNICIFWVLFCTLLRRQFIGRASLSLRGSNERRDLRALWKRVAPSVRPSSPSALPDGAARCFPLTQASPERQAESREGRVEPRALAKVLSTREFADATNPIAPRGPRPASVIIQLFGVFHISHPHPSRFSPPAEK